MIGENSMIQSSMVDGGRGRSLVGGNSIIGSLRKSSNSPKPRVSITKSGQSAEELE